MSLSQRDRLRAEVGQLKSMLDELDGDDWISRKGLQGRLSQVEEQLQALGDETVAQTAAVTFRGAPVVGSKGSEAKFTATALQNFTKLLTELANQTRAKLVNASSSVVPEFLFAGTATGSFGFVIEEKGATAETTVLKSAGELLNAATDDDRFADALEDTDPEVMASLRKFLSSLNSSGATVRVAGSDWRASLDDAETLRAAVKRTETVKEATEQILRGALIGLMPNERRFEFRVHPTQEVLHGKFTAKTWREKESALYAALNTMGLLTVRVRTFEKPWGGSRTSYELLDFERSEPRIGEW